MDNVEEKSCEVLLKPHKDFVRSDNSISSTPSRDLGLCFEVVLKEAAKEERLVKQIFYTALSAYTNNPINLAINAPSGEGKTHVLMKVSDLFPEKDVQFIADMSDKAIFHKNGYLGIKNEDGEYENIEGELSGLQESLETKINDYRKTENNDKATKDELKKEIDTFQKQIKALRDKAVKVIDLNHKILIFLDTPKDTIFKAFMSLLSHDKFAVEYQYVDTSTPGITTKINVLLGWPAVIFAQAVDYTNHSRYQEIQRRFIVTNPRMDREKYQNAVNLIIEKNCIPDFIYQLLVVSDEEKKKARDIILNIRDDLLTVSSTIKPGKNHVLVPYRQLINRLLSKNTTAQDMTFVNRLLNLVVLLTSINVKKRPFMEIKPTFGSESFRIPMALFSDLSEALSLTNNSAGGIRPYVLEWYRKVFLDLYHSKTNPNSKFKNGEEVTEERIAVTTQELIEKTKKVTNKNSTSKNLLNEFLYPLLNLGYIDSIHSLIDKRAYIFFPVLDTTNDKSINLFLLDKKNNLLDENRTNNINIISHCDKTQIIFNIRESERYYSDNGFSVDLKIADADVTDSESEDEHDYKVEEIVDKYYYNENSLSCKSVDNQESNVSEDRFKEIPFSEEYLLTLEKSNLSSHTYKKDIKNLDNLSVNSNNLFFSVEKNKIIYSCYHCDFTVDEKIEYERHFVQRHPGKLAYPDMTTIEKEGLIPQGKPWEKEEGHV